MFLQSAMIRAESKVNPQFWGGRWPNPSLEELACFYTHVPRVSISLWSLEKLQNGKKTVWKVEYLNLCTDVFHSSLNLFSKYH